MILRRSVPEDANLMTGLLNEIIRLGGTTAHQCAKSARQMRTDYIDELYVVTAVLAGDKNKIIGWQAVGIWPGLPPGWGDIGTFVRAGMQARSSMGVSFEKTTLVARAAALRALNATIRADYAAGLAFCPRMGFVGHGHDPKFTLTAGLPLLPDRLIPRPL